MADSTALEVNGENVKEPGSSVTEEKAVLQKGGDSTNSTTTKKIESDLDAKIVRQVEYYFGDINLARDRFLQEEVKKKNGWVSLDVLLKFKRLAALTTDKPTIVSALRKSSDLMQISEDESEIRRDPERPLPEMNEERRKELMTRTLYFKGFPLTTTLDQILEFFNNLATVENVIMRSFKDKALGVWQFKGSVFVVFGTKDAADKFLKQESVKYEDQELIKMWQNEYVENKRKERLDAKVQKKKNQNPEDEDDEKEEKDDGLPKNAVLHLSGCPSDLTRELIKEKMEEFEASVAFVDYNKGDSEGWVRLQEEGKALEVLEKVEEGKLKIGENTIEIRVLEGEEETKFLEKVKADIAKRRSQGHKGRRPRRGGFGGRGNYGRSNFSRKRKSSPVSDRGTAAKRSMADS